MPLSKRAIPGLCCALLLFSLNACEQKARGPSAEGGAPHAAGVTIQVWAHAGQASERKVLQSQVKQFNKQAGDATVELTFIPERDYNAQIQAAALAGDLPDVLEFDGPYLYNYIWQNHLIPLERLLPPFIIKDLLPSILNQGMHGDHLYSVGVFDSGLGLYARRSALLQIGVRIPDKPGDAWSVLEFNEVLKKLAQQKKKTGAVLDLKLNYSGEWYTYGFSPVLQSAGADLINRDTYQTSTGFLNSPAAVAAMQYIQGWIQQGLVDPNLDDAAFITGRVVLSWAGHWEYARYRKAFKDDLIVLPLPDFGVGSKTGQGSWNWGVTDKCQHQEAAANFIRFLLQDDQVLLMTNANGAVPGTRSAVQKSGLYGEKGALRLFANQLLGGVSVPRPKTPAYPVITTAFQEAFRQIRNGTNVKQALDVATQKINQDIRDNQGYPFSNRKAVE